MQKSIGAYKLKTHVSQVLSELEQGTEFMVTRNSKPVGKLVPFGPSHLRESGFLPVGREAGDKLIEPMTNEEWTDWYGS
jgi:antitoxin (DNA-binding transcriptional repressor) of toxin-antitoxin stability system